MHNHEHAIRELLDRVARREQSPEEALESLRHLPFEDLGFAKIDHHRELRRGFPEVVYCAGKTLEQVAQIVDRMSHRADRVLGTRATEAQYQAARALVADLHYDALGRALWIDRKAESPRQSGVVLVAAGTSDLPVAEEASIALNLMGHSAERIYDVGVAGLHRLLEHLPALRDANVVIVIAGMDGALPSVVGGLVSAPVIAVPTSVGYGASFGGIAALLAMLNSCAPGLAVMNIDNGYGAAYLAAVINSRTGSKDGHRAP